MCKTRDSFEIRDLIRELERDGWQKVRTRGSHRQFKHPTKSGTLTMAGEPGLDIPPGTLSAILKQAGLKD
ncbi:MAG: type II toxin-antitoxin system HicA family toxin [Acidobacteriota bacterium]